MAEHLDIIEGTKDEKYRALLPQVAAVIDGEPDLIANMANVASMLHETFGFWWTGFYRVLTSDASKDTRSSSLHNSASSPQGSASSPQGFASSPQDSQDEALVLGPFQGPLACVRIRKGRGVCGTAWAEARTVVVPDVEAFPGHIACSSASRSEIVVPLLRDGRVIAVLDIDSEHLATFDDTDSKYLEQIAALLTA